MLKNYSVFVVGLLMSFSAYGAEYARLATTDEDADSKSAHYADSEDLVSNELAALETGAPTDIDIGNDLLKKALYQNVFRTPDKREKLDQMLKDQPEGFKLLAQLFNAQLPKRTVPGGEPFEKTPARVRPAASIRLDKATQEAVAAALKQYHLEKSYEQLKIYLETAHMNNAELREELAEMKKEMKDYRKKYHRTKRELEKYKPSQSTSELVQPQPVYGSISAVFKEDQDSVKD